MILFNPLQGPKSTSALNPSEVTPRGALRKKYSEKMQQIYWRTPILKCNFNKFCFANLLKSHFGVSVLLQICCIFSEYLSQWTHLGGCFWSSLSTFAWRYFKMRSHFESSENLLMTLVWWIMILFHEISSHKIDVLREEIYYTAELALKWDASLRWRISFHINVSYITFHYWSISTYVKIL